MYDNTRATLLYYVIKYIDKYIFNIQNIIWSVLKRFKDSQNNGLDSADGNIQMNKNNVIFSSDRHHCHKSSNVLKT